MLKTLKKYSIICLSIVVLLPVIGQLVHVFENHEHHVSNSKDMQQYHAEDADCSLCHLQVEPLILLDSEEYTVFDDPDSVLYSISYNSFSNYQQLSFSLRGPPVFS